MEKAYIHDEEDAQNVDNEKTSLLSNDDLKKNHGNGHLISGIGANGEAESSSDTEGADEKGSDEEGSVIIHGTNSDQQMHQQQHFQSVKLEDDHDQLGHNEA